MTTTTELRQRIIKEHGTLHHDIMELHQFIRSDKFKEIGNVVEQELLHNQLYVMGLYQEILKRRIDQYELHY